MTKITIGGKQREMRYTYDAIDYIEEAFDTSVFQVFQEKDIMRQRTVRKLLYASLLHEQNVESEEDFTNAVREDADKGKIDTMDIVEKIMKAFEDSQPLQKAFNEGKKHQAKLEKVSG